MRYHDCKRDMKSTRTMYITIEIAIACVNGVFHIKRKLCRTCVRRWTHKAEGKLST